MLGGSASAVIGNEGAAVAEEGVLEDGEGRQHKAMNPTTRKVRCRFHSEVVVKRHKLRTASVLTPCWRCLEVSCKRPRAKLTMHLDCVIVDDPGRSMDGSIDRPRCQQHHMLTTPNKQEAKVQAHEGQKAAEARVDFLHCALQEEKGERVICVIDRSYTSTCLHFKHPRSDTILIYDSICCGVTAEHGVVLERRAAALEEEQLGLRQQIAKLVEQVGRQTTGLSDDD